MLPYIFRRVILLIPTLFGILVINFIVVQFTSDGLVEQVLAKISLGATGSTDRFGGRGADGPMERQKGQTTGGASTDIISKYRDALGRDVELVREIEATHGLDKPVHVRFARLIHNCLTFDFGNSFNENRSAVDLILSKLDVSISLGLWTTLIVYLVSIPLGIGKAVRDGSRFDVATSTVISVGFAIPAFLVAIALLILFAGGRYWQWFPIIGISSPNWDELSLMGKVLDWLWHLVLPVTAMVIGAFATLTLLVKNSFLDQIAMQYVLTARAKGLSERRVLYGHVFRNAMLIVIAGFPSAFVGMFFTSSLLIEVTFSLDGLGLLGYEAIMGYDYPVVYASLYFFSLIGLVMGLVSDLMYAFVDPRIDFASREV